MRIVTPHSADDVKDALADAIRAGARLEIRGGGSKTDFGAPREATILDMRGFSRVIDYDPAELVLTVGAGVPLSQVHALLRSEDQMLAFDPWDQGLLYGRPGITTIGGVVVAGVAGPARVTTGGARDHLLGFTAVSGRGEAFVGGAKVVKNVTGYDLPKLMAGSWGRLAALTQLTLRVLPRPRSITTLAADDLSPRQAHAIMTRALGSNANVSAAAHIPAVLRDGRSLTILAVAGFEPSVMARCASLSALFAADHPLRPLEQEGAASAWDAVRHARPLTGDILWRVHVRPSSVCDLIALLEPYGVRWLMDWGGGLLWVESDAQDGMVRSIASAAGGQATLVRARPEMRTHVPALHPGAPSVVALEARVRAAFDPRGVWETGRFLEDAYAD